MVNFPFFTRHIIQNESPRPRRAGGIAPYTFPHLIWDFWGNLSYAGEHQADIALTERFFVFLSTTYWLFIWILHKMRQKGNFMFFIFIQYAYLKFVQISPDMHNFIMVFRFSKWQSREANRRQKIHERAAGFAIAVLQDRHSLPRQKVPRESRFARFKRMIKTYVCTKSL